MACEARAPRSQRGFVLAVTLWVLAAIAVIVGAMTFWAVEEVRSAADDRQRTDDLIAMHSTRDTLLYIGATSDLTFAGMPTQPPGEAELAIARLDEMGAFKHDPRGGELRLDSTRYAGLGDIAFALQDEAGLFGVMVPNESLLGRLLQAEHADQDAIPRLQDALLDYIDPDDLRHLNGAEKREYERARLPPPPNRRLLLPGEIRRVLGWRALPGQGALPDLLTTFYSGAVNLNTMPAALLPVWLPGCPRTCELFAEMRKRKAFQSGAEVQTLLGIRLPGDDAVDYRFLASDVLRVTFWGKSGEAWRIHVRFTPLADQRGPWSILAAYPVPRPDEHASAQPTGSALFADAPTDRQ